MKSHNHTRWGGRIDELMKIIVSLLLCIVMSAVAHAQDYLGTYNAGPPSQARIEILPSRIKFTGFNIKPKVTNITYTKEGHFLLLEDRNYGTTMYHAAFLYDNNTVYTRISQMNFTNQSGGI
jgi:hypothetical protein